TSMDRERRVPIWLWILACVPSGCFLLYFRDELYLDLQSKMLMGGVALAWILAATTWVALVTSPIWSRVLKTIIERTPIRRLVGDPLVWHALVPIGLVSLVSLHTPRIADRTLMVVLPMLAILVARGVWALPRAMSVAALVVVFGIMPFSIVQHTYGERRHIGSDFRSVHAAIVDEVRADDLVLIEDHWAMLSMHYYFPPSRYRTVNAQIIRDRMDSGRLPVDSPPRTWLFPGGGELELDEQMARLEAVARLYGPPQFFGSGEHQAVLLVPRAVGGGGTSQ
ncbi:MAG: hypothetical protein CMJ49_01680, partial [Planctomycetaceae bacterium]|nr:hypothetical protein [Planctomycetaceae bacterium]